MVNTPLPKSLEEECKKAARILRSFTMDSVESGGVDRVIPPTLIMRAKGLAIMTVVKAGFLVSARAGSGICVAHLSDGTWSAPSAIATAGIGGGFEIGAEITDFVFILNSQSAVDAFSKGGNVTLGGNLSVAVGPLGRNVEGDIAVRSPATIYTYSKTKGLFAGISVEGSGIIERREANEKMYGKEVRSRQLLQGTVPPPPEAEPLYQALRDHCEGMLGRTAQFAMKQAGSAAMKETEGRSMSFGGKTFKPSFGKGGGQRGDASTPLTYSEQRRELEKRQGSAAPSTRSSSVRAGSSYSAPRSSSVRASSGSTRTSRSSYSSRLERSSSSSSRRTSSASEDLNAMWGEEIRVRARYPYSSDNISDLTFRRGDEFVVLTRTDTQDDWWEGRLRGKTGIFPANYVEVL